MDTNASLTQQMFEKMKAAAETKQGDQGAGENRFVGGTPVSVAGKG